MNIHRAALRALGVGALVVALAAAVGSSALAQSGGGNSINAQACQKGGWQQLVASTGASFGNEGQCTSYAARGGTLFTPGAYDESQWQTTCESAGGAFGTQSNEWDCYGFDSYNQPLYGALAPICQAAGGTPSGETFGPGIWLFITCEF